MQQLRTIARLYLTFIIVFILQKMYFMLMTWQAGTTYTDMLDVIWHGLKLDNAVAGYFLVLPWLVLVIDSIVSNRFTKSILKWYGIAIAIITSVIIVADASLYPFWHFKLDASAFLYTDKPKDALASVSIGFIATRLLWFAVWMWVTYRIWSIIGRVSFRGNNYFSKLHLPVSRGILWFLIGCALTLAIRGGVGKGTNNVSAAYYSENQYLNHSAVNPVFNLLYSLGKQEDFGSEAQFFSDKECEETLQGIYHTDSTAPDTLLNSDRPDILLIIWEGACAYVCDSLNAAPNLKQLRKEGIDFTNCHASSFRTDRGQLSLIAGWPAIPKTSLMKIPEKCDHLPAIPRTLLRAGYSTTFWYGGDISFANTGGYMHQAGFQKTVSDADFSKKDIATAWGVYDGTLLDRLTETFLKESAGKPSMHTVMTLSSHEPWTVPVKQFDDERLNAFYYTDQCIGKMIARLRQSPRWNNLLVIITADHGIALTEDTNFGDPHVTRIPMLWLGGAIKQAKKIPAIISQCDLPATLLSQMHLPHDDFEFSRDVMSQSYTYPTAFHCYNGGITFRDSTGYTIYDLDGQRPIHAPNTDRERKAKATLQKLYRRIAEL